MAASADGMAITTSAAPLPLATVHQRFRQPLRRFFASCRLNAADAEDLTQEVFLRLVRQPGHVTIERPEAYVFTLARNLVRDRARRCQTRAQAASLASDSQELASAAAGPPEQLEQHQRLAGALAALARLRPVTRQAFLLHRLHGLSHAEVAQALGVSVSMVEKHLMAAIAALRDDER